MTIPTGHLEEPGSDHEPFGMKHVVQKHTAEGQVTITTGHLEEPGCLEEGGWLPRVTGGTGVLCEPGPLGCGVPNTWGY